MTDYLSLCLICKDENQYLQEWIDYHILAGVQRFYIYDNDSQVPVRETLAEYIRLGWVVVMEILGRPKQLNAYDHCIHVFGKQSHWIGFIDTDEYLVPKKSSDIKEILKEYEEYGGLVVSSYFFGSNGRQKPLPGGQMAAYTMRTDEAFVENKLIKSIVQPEKILFAHTPHDFIYQQDVISVNEEKKYVDNQRFPHRSAVIQLNHYYCRSLDEIDQKIQRGRGDTTGAWQRNRFNATNRLAVYQDTQILDLVQRLVQARDPQAWSSDLLDPKTSALLDTMHRLVLESTPPPPLTAEIPAEVVDRPEFLEWLEMKLDITKGMGVGFREGRAALARMNERFPNRVVILNDIAKASLPLGEYDVAWQFLAQSWRLAPGAFSVLEQMTLYYRLRRQTDMAEKTARLRLEIAPRDGGALADLALAFFAQGRWEDALKIGLPVVEMNWITRELEPLLARDLAIRVGEALHKSGNVNKAIEVLKTTAQKFKKHSQVYIKLARIYLAEHKLFEARKALLEAEEVNPKDPDLAFLKEALGK